MEEIKMETEHAHAIVMKGDDADHRLVVAVAQNYQRVEVDPTTLARIKQMRQWIEDTGSKEPVYGYTRGCGNFQDREINDGAMIEYQRRYINAHCVGVGAPFLPEVVRGAMVIRLYSFLKCHSGVSPEIVLALRDMLNSSLIPYVPAEGSVGASGDLCPLAHVSAVMMGFAEAKAWVNGNGPFPAPQALEMVKLKPYTFRGKEAMAMTNGANFMLAELILSLPRIEQIIDLACAATALTVEAIRGCPDAFDPRIHEARPHPGQIAIARKVNRLLQESTFATLEARMRTLPWSPRNDNPPHDPQPDKRVQDFYSVRCFPQIAGALWHALNDAHQIAHDEFGAATDNPLYFPREDGGYQAISGGNFHGQILADPTDRLITNLAKLAVTMNFQSLQMLMPLLSGHLPDNLDFTRDGQNCSFMIPQYTQARLAAHLQKLAYPAGVLSHPTSGMQEDVVSMGAISTHDLHQEVLWRIEHLLAIQFLEAAQAISGLIKNLGDDLQLAPAMSAMYQLIMDRVPRNELAKNERLLMADDHFIHDKIMAMVTLLPQIASIVRVYTDK
jgi:histidine ammonia-lyase